MRLIDADALKDLEEMEYIYFKSPAAVPFYEAHKVWDVIEKAPTIEADPVRHGRWEKRGQEIYCSKCGEESGYTWAGASRYSDYCPNCGAKMDGGGADDKA